jgi:antitoxin component HigA of HigAB toxin-antitoxin module
MTGTVLLYDPTAPRQERPMQVQQALAGLAGKVVGFIDNAKPNFNYLVDDLAELLTSKHGVSRVLKRQKRSASVPAPDDVIKEFAEQCDLVITGSGD